MTNKRSISPRKYDQLKPRVDVHEAITAKIVAAIEAGAGTFEMPWHRPGVAFSLPRNALTNKTYRGSNILSLWIDADDKKFEHQIWSTFKQWQELGAQVRKGERGSMIVKFGEWMPKSTDSPVAASADAGGHQKRNNSAQPKDKQDADEDDGKRLYAKAAYVFNIDQVEASAELRETVLPPTAPHRDLTERLAHVDAFIAAIGIEIREGGQRAFYRHRGSNGDGDFIQMPPRELFIGTATSTPTESYYATILHEEIHGSGAEHRLDRKLGRRFGDHQTAVEEIVAELGAAFLCAELEITNTPRLDHAQYVASWVTVLKGDAKAIFAAASLATRAVDYLYGLQPETDPATRHGPDPSRQNTGDAPGRPPGGDASVNAVAIPGEPQ